MATLLAAVAILSVVFAVGFLAGRRTATAREERAWLYLSDLRWARANTGWIGAADDFLPRLDSAFNLRAISLNGRVFPKGIGTFPLSEIEYPLDRKYSTYRAQVGINDGVPTGSGSVNFMVFVDNRIAFDSGLMSGNDPPQSINVSVADADTLRLVVTDGGDGTEWDYASWGGARLLTKDPWSLEAFAYDLRRAVESKRNAKSAQQEREKDELKVSSAKKVVDLQKAFAGEAAADPTVKATYDRANDQFILANDRIALYYGLGGPKHAKLSVLQMSSNSLMVDNAVISTSDDGKRWVNFHDSTKAAGTEPYKIEDVSDDGLGSGKRVTFELVDLEELRPIHAIFTLYDYKPYFTLQVSMEGHSSPKPAYLRFFDMTAGSELVIGSNAEYVSDYSKLRQGKITDDSVIRKETIGLGKPIFLWNNETNQGILQAMIDVSEYPIYFVTKMDPGRVTANFTLEHYDPHILSSSDEMIASRRLYVELTDSSDTRYAFGNFKRVMSELYPPAPLPGWVKYQWLSWYVNYMDISEEGITRQIDYIADNLLDLGDWNILIDAGWYVAEGREGSGWRSVDYSKFPNGLRSVVDYAHARGLKVVLYFSSPYLDDRQLSGNWLSLKGIVAQYRDWLIPLVEDSSGSSYVYDYSNPEWLNYLTLVLQDFFIEYDVDGLKLDGMGDAEGAIINLVLRGAFGQNQLSLTQSLQTYRFLAETANKLRDDVYIESGWVTPVFAHPYAQTFRYGDEFPAFDNRYPFSGLEQHIDYAIIQKTMLGQRPNMGAIYGDANEDSLGLSWLEAALALGTQVSLSLDMPTMSDNSLSDYRSRLVHYNAFQGETAFGGTLHPDTFRTTYNDITYLGVMNRQEVARSVPVDFAQLGMIVDANHVAYDVTGDLFFKLSQSFSVEMEPHSFRLFVIRALPGMIWTNSSYSVSSQSENSMTLELSGPAAIDGFAKIHVPLPNYVSLDGSELQRNTGTDGMQDSYLYDFENQILSLNCDYLSAHTLVIEW